ncbi:hypothetical protein ACQP00_14245 [Dactylosporangium sp. CS-047395]|uniref:hypothetical protein n=1 Tax=Dactylosporangium sp. CS-047395 TaxID=3239936 RepID=UPI003D941299
MPDPLWPHTTAALKIEGSAAADVLRAAMDDVERAGARVDLDRQQRDGALWFAPVTFAFDHDPTLKVDIFALGAAPRRRVELNLAVIRSALEKGVDELGLLAYAILEAEPLPSGWRPRRIGEAHPPDRAQLIEQMRVFKGTPAYDAVENALTKGQDVLLLGDHGSGRSALAAAIADERAGAGRGVVWLNLTDPADGPESVVRTLLELEQAQDYLLIVDGLHANLPIVTNVFRCVKRLRQDYDLPIRVLAIGLPPVAELLQQGEQRVLDLYEVPIDGRDTVRLMLDEEEGLAPADRSRIERLVDTDVHMADTALKFYRSNERRVPTQLDLQEEYTRDTTDPAEQHALYHLACLGSLGLVIAARKAADLFGPAVERLHARKLIHRTDDAYTIGPRRRAQLVMRYARRTWPDVCRDKPEDIAWRHLQRSGTRGIRAVFSQLDRFVSPERMRWSNLRLQATWDIVERVDATLEVLTRRDPTWGGTLGASVFAATAFIRHRPEEPDRWALIAGPIRAKWKYLDPIAVLPEPIGDPTTDITDFLHIVKRMENEDRLYSPDKHPSGMAAAGIQPRRAYQNWALGLLLGLEGTAPPEHRERARIEALVAMARRAQEIDGNFYPARVPWVTARIVIGLCQAGHAGDLVVQRACSWLLDRLGPAAVHWRSGTGDWNSDEATTSMCLTGLYLAGFVRRDTIDSAVTWLQERVEECAKPDREIDLANMLETLALYTNWPIQTNLVELLNRVESESRQLLERPELSRDARPEEALRVPFISSQLTNMAWARVRAEFRGLLENVLNGNEEEAVSPYVPTLPAVPKPVPDAVEAAIPKLSPEELRRWTDAAEQLHQRLEQQLRVRSGPAVSGAPSVQQKLNQLQKQRDLYQTLNQLLSPDAPREVLTALDELGREVCGGAWPLQLPFPSADDAGGPR